MLMLIKNINIKSLVSGDKSARITLETLRPEDIPTLAMLSDKMEIEVEFKSDGVTFVAANMEQEENKIPENSPVIKMSCVPSGYIPPGTECR